MELNEVRIVHMQEIVVDGVLQPPYWSIQTVFKIGDTQKWVALKRETEPTVDDAVGLVAEAIKQLGNQPNG